MATDVTSEAPVAEEVNPGQAFYEKLAHELTELEKQFPLPERADQLADAKWFEERWVKPAFEPYRGTCIAVLNEAVVATGDDELQLEIDVSRRFNVHPARPLIAYIPRRGEWSAHVHIESDG